MGITFRLVTENLVPKISEMMKEFYGIDNYPFNIDQAKKNVFRFINDDNLGRLWAIFSYEDLAGYVILTYGFSFEYNGRDAFIDELFLKEGFRGKGIGSATLKYLFNQAKELGINAIHLEVEKNNERGNMLYTKQGFEGNDRRLLTRIID